MEFKVKVVLFDLWDTLFHHFMEKHPVHQIKDLTVGEKMGWKEFVKIAEHSLQLKDFGENGLNFKEFFKELKVKPSKELEQKLRKVWIGGAISSGPFEDVLPILKQLKKNGFKLAIISNTTSYKMHFLLKKSGFDELFDFVCLSCWVHLLKPDPRIFKRALKELNASPNEAVMVGNSIESDIKGANSAKIKTILLDREYKYINAKSIPANALIHSLNELPALLELKR